MLQAEPVWTVGKDGESLGCDGAQATVGCPEAPSNIGSAQGLNGAWKRQWSTEVIFRNDLLPCQKKHIQSAEDFIILFYKKKKTTITWKQHADKSIRMAKNQNTDHTQCWQESGAHSFRNSHSLLVSMQNDAATLEDSQSLHNWTYSCHAVQQSCFLMFAQRNWELISTLKPEHGCL